MNWLKLAALSVLTLFAALFLIFQFGDFTVRELEQRVGQLQQERQRLLEYARRLSETRRVAQVTVLDQRRDEQGRTVNTLRWQEIGPNGVVGAPQECTVLGAQAYFEAQVLKFAPMHVGEGDPLRGASLALFRRIFGDAQPADSVPDLGRATRPPITDDPEAAAFHERLWGLFWEFADNPALARQYGVRVAQVEAPAAVRLKAGQVWEVTLDAAGGLNVTRMEQRDRTP